jgi:hypothetical protein
MIGHTLPTANIPPHYRTFYDLEYKAPETPDERYFGAYPDFDFVTKSRSTSLRDLTPATRPPPNGIDKDSPTDGCGWGAFVIRYSTNLIIRSKGKIT